MENAEQHHDPVATCTLKRLAGPEDHACSYLEIRPSLESNFVEVD